MLISSNKKLYISLSTVNVIITIPTIVLAMVQQKLMTSKALTQKKWMCLCLVCVSSCGLWDHPTMLITFSWEAQSYKTSSGSLLIVTRGKVSKRLFYFVISSLICVCTFERFIKCYLVVFIIIFSKHSLAIFCCWGVLLLCLANFS